MPNPALTSSYSRVPLLRDVIELAKPVTWFPPMWAFLCGVVASGMPISANWLFLIAGMALTGPLVCGTSQIINDWCDRYVDAINEPDRPIPSGRVPGRWPVGLAVGGAMLSLALAAALGPLVIAATLAALLCGWSYSAAPFRFKRSGWMGPLVCALSYEGLAWFTGTAVMQNVVPPAPILLVLLFYSLGAHGIMTLNDFKAVVGDRAMGLRSLPVVLGVHRAALFACAVMALGQVAVIAVLAAEAHYVSAGIVAALLLVQGAMMPRLIADPARNAPWYNGTGVGPYVLGMLAAALGLGGYI
jgi:chlorophyll/bacteriochlorophyll a synthase